MNNKYPWGLGAMTVGDLKREAAPLHADDVYGVETRCLATAPEGTVDDWGDSCAGYPCLRGEGHSGDHEASDGAN